MKKLTKLMLFCSFLLVFSTTNTACSKKTGCPMNEMTKKDKKLSTKGGKSNLFPKHMRKGRKKKKRG